MAADAQAGALALLERTGHPPRHAVAPGSQRRPGTRCPQGLEEARSLADTLALAPRDSLSHF